MRDFVAHVRRHLSRLDVAEGRYDEVVDQLASELEARYSALVERGATDEDAWNDVLAQIPSWPALAHDLAAAGPRPVIHRRPSRLLALFGLDRWLQDLTHSVRVLRKDRGFTATAIVTLAICLGGHAAIVAGVNGVLLHPLPVPEPERVLLMANQYPLVETRRQTSSATPDYEDRLRHVTVFEEQALYNYSGATIDVGGIPTRTLGIVATPSLLRLLRVTSRAWAHLHRERKHHWQRGARHPQRRTLARAVRRRSGRRRPHAAGHRSRLHDRRRPSAGLFVRRSRHPLLDSAGHDRPAALRRCTPQQRLDERRTPEAGSDDRAGASPAPDSRSRESGAHRATTEADPDQYRLLHQRRAARGRDGSRCHRLLCPCCGRLRLPCS